MTPTPDNRRRSARKGAGRHRATVTVLATLMASGCSASGGGSDEAAAYQTPAVESVRVVDSSVRLPFRDYELSDADRTRMQTGEAQLLVRCMAARGFKVSIGGDYLTGAPRTGPADPFMWGGPFGTMPLEHAQQYGYKPAPGAAFVKGPGFYYSNPGHLFLESKGVGNDDAAAEAAFYGAAAEDPAASDLPGEQDSQVRESSQADQSSQGDGADQPGCLAEVEATIDVPLVETIDLEAELGQLAREHPAVETATGKWIDCMKQRGHNYAKVWEASNEFSILPVSRHQIDVAVDDVECTGESGWPNYYYAVVSDYENQAIKRDPALLESALSAEQKRLAAIERELANGG